MINVPDNIMHQIKSLLNKTVSNGCSEEESATAAGLAQKMLMKWGIGMSDLVEETAPSNDIKIDEHFSDGVESGNRISAWKSSLLQAVAKSNNCELIFRTAWDHSKGSDLRREKIQRMILIGQERDAAVCKALYEILRDTIEGRAKVRQPSGFNRGEGKGWANSFKLGAVAAISNRLKLARSQVKVELGEAFSDARSCTALARMDNAEDALRNHINQMSLRTRQSSVSRIDYDAYSAGQREGNSISLSSKVLK